MRTVILSVRKYKNGDYKLSLNDKKYNSKLKLIQDLVHNLGPRDVCKIKYKSKLSEEDKEFDEVINRLVNEYNEWVYNSNWEITEKDKIIERERRKRLGLEKCIKESFGHLFRD